MRCGVDIVYIPALRHKFQNEAVLKKFFHQNEMKNPSLEHLAGIIAAKEAFFKAVGKVPKFLDVQVAYQDGGRPYIVAAPKWQTYKDCDVSISHDQDYAIAMVILTT